MEEFGWIKSGDYYYYTGGTEKGICKPKDVIPVFSQLTIPKSWDQDIADQEFKITISAEAVQAAHFEPMQNGNKIEWLMTREDGTIVEVTPETYEP